MSCRFPDCNVEKLQRFGLCNRHRKWVEKGIIDLECNFLKDVKLRGYYRNGAVCKVSGCGKKPRRNYFCIAHGHQYKNGSIDFDGNRIKPPRIYPPGTECKRCGDTGKIVKGFCKMHYSQYLKGKIDFDGKVLVEPKRASYGPDDTCIVRKCFRRPRVRGFCASHFESKKKGYYDEHGRRLVDEICKNQGNKCLECDNEAKIKLLCPTHYHRKYYRKKRVFINKGKQCSVEFCGSSAYAKGLCLLHYGRHKAKIKALRISEAEPEQGIGECASSGKDSRL